MHYIHDNEVDSILEVPSGAADQLTKLQQFLLKENNDFREVETVDDSGKAVPYFTVKDSDFREQFLKSRTDENSGSNPELGGDRDSTISLGEHRKKSSVSDYQSDRISDFGEHNLNMDVWPYLNADEELRNKTGVSDEGDDEEEEEEGRRRRRSLTKWKYLQRGGEKTMEMLVVVDKTMMDRHGNKNITTYTLTLFNMVCGTGWLFASSSSSSSFSSSCSSSFPPSSLFIFFMKSLRD